MARIILDSQEKIEIVNSEGEVTGCLWWNPSDLDIVKRCESVVDFFDHMEMPEDNNADSLFAMSDTIKKQFDYLFSPGASEVLFKYANPLSPREDGTLFAEYVLNQLIVFIETELDVRMKKTTSRIEKYTAKYKK